MALAIVTAQESDHEQFEGVCRTTRPLGDQFSGTKDALMAAGLITEAHLVPQVGRAVGHTVFLPNGEPCPLHVRACRTPGYKSLRLQRDGTYLLEVTASKEVQSWRRTAAREERKKRREASAKREIATNGHRYNNWVLRQTCEYNGETWEGTKEQLQGLGLGIGMLFPGEPGAPEELDCRCPLGFEFRVHLPKYDSAKAAAGIYLAFSPFVPSREKPPKQFYDYAPGVQGEMWLPSYYWTDSNHFHGTAQALVEAGLVPRIELFPGHRDNMPKEQAKYSSGWQLCSTVRHNTSWIATIRRRGKSNQFVVEVPASDQERQQRRQQREAFEDELERKGQELCEERKRARQGAAPQVSADDFRKERARSVDVWLNVLWTDVFSKSDDGLSFDVPEHGKVWTQLADAFESIRECVGAADILTPAAQRPATRASLKLAAESGRGSQAHRRVAPQLSLVR